MVAKVPGAGMVVWCAWCEALLGLREPFEDWSTMLAVCVDCAQKYGPRLPDDPGPGAAPPENPERRAEQDSE